MDASRGKKRRSPKSKPKKSSEVSTATLPSTAEASENQEEVNERSDDGVSQCVGQSDDLSTEISAENSFHASDPSLDVSYPPETAGYDITAQVADSIDNACTHQSEQAQIAEVPAEDTLQQPEVIGTTPVAHGVSVVDIHNGFQVKTFIFD